VVDEADLVGVDAELAPVAELADGPARLPETVAVTEGGFSSVDGHQAGAGCGVDDAGPGEGQFGAFGASAHAEGGGVVLRADRHGHQPGGSGADGLDIGHAFGRFDPGHHPHRPGREAGQALQQREVVVDVDQRGRPVDLREVDAVEAGPDDGGQVVLQEAAVDVVGPDVDEAAVAGECPDRLGHGRPGRMPRARRMPRSRSAVHTEDTRPKSVPLAMRSASASSPARRTVSTGPNTSSRATAASGVTSTSSVGRTKYPPSRPATSVADPPEATAQPATRAPSM